MLIAVASDHAGYRYKQHVRELLATWGHEVLDFGTDSEAPVDYPEFIRPAALAVSRGLADRAIIFGGSGNGEAMVANRIAGVRCAVSWSVESARLSREHNDANVLSIGERLVPSAELEAIVRTWLETGFHGGRHARRIALIDQPFSRRDTASPEERGQG